MPRKQMDHRAAMLAKRIQKYRDENPSSDRVVRDLIVEADSNYVHVFVRWADSQEDKHRYGAYFGAYEMARDVIYRIEMRTGAILAAQRGDARQASRFLENARTGDMSIG